MRSFQPMRMSLVTLSLFVLTVGLGWPTPAPSSAQPAKGRNYALLVACQDYDGKELRPLKYTRNDILQFHEVLLASGFHADDVVLIHDKQEDTKLRPLGKYIRQQLEVLLAGLRPQDTVVIAFAGHGVQWKSSAKNYFCPFDAQFKDKSTLIDLEDIYKQLAACKAERKLLVVDACRKNPASELARSEARPEVDGLDSVTRPQTVPPPKGVVALFSCSAGQEAFEHPDLGHGIFFYHLVKGWKGAAAREGEVTLNLLTDYVQVETTKYARQKLLVVQVPQQKNDFSGVWVLKNSKSKSLSSLDLLLQKVLKAHRGEANIGKLWRSQFKFQGTTKIDDMDVPIKGESLQNLPHQVKREVHLELNGKKIEFVEVNDKGTCWVTLDGKLTDPGEERQAEAKFELYLAQMSSLIPLYKDKSLQISLQKEEIIGGKPALGIKVVSEGNKDVSIFFDKESSLLAKLSWTSKDPKNNNPVLVEEYFHDYRVTGGFFGPTRVDHFRDGAKIGTSEVTEVTFVKEFPASIFARPK